MTAVAVGLAEGLVGATEKTGAQVDGIFVLCYRASDDTCGGAIHGPEVSLDSMIGMVVGILGKLRNEKAAADASKKATQ
jgi:hypothetical protein